MIGARLWKRRLQPVTTGVVVFNDSADFHADPLSDAGATLPSLTPSVAPRPSYVHRSSVESFNWLDSVPPEVFRPSRRPGRRLLRVPAKPPAWRAVPRVAASFAEFNRLRLNPRVATCVRRRVRKEVLFARRVAGSRGIRHYRRTVHSQWSC